MELSVQQLAIVYSAVLLSSSVQSATGFAAGLIAIPTLLAAGIELPTAVAVTMISAAVQNLAGVVRLRSEIDWRFVRLPAVLRIVSIPVGAAIFLMLANSGIDHRVTIRQFIGLLILAILAAQHFLKIEPEVKQPAFWIWVAFPFSGFLQGLVGLAGPPMVLWLMAHDWSANKSRGFLFAMFLTGLPFHLLVIGFLWPASLWAGFLIALISLPATAIGTLIGLAAGKRIRRQLLRRITVGLLVIIAINCLIAPWL